MSLIASLSAWLKEFDGGVITTDIMLMPTPARSISARSTGTAIVDVLGNREYTNNYIFRLRSLSIDEADRVENNDVIEQLTRWVYNRNDDGDYPILEYGVVEDIKVTNAVLSTINEDGTTEYEVLLAVKIFEKRRG